MAKTTFVEMAATISRESFGVGYAAVNLAAALARAGENVYLASVDEAKVAYEVCEETGFPRERMIVGKLVGHPRLRFSPGLVGMVMEVVGKTQRPSTPLRSAGDDREGGNVVVHSHGIWTYMSYVAGVLRDRWECPLVVSPHGSLEPYTLTMSPGKKALATMLYEGRNLKTASCLWALSEQEKEAIRAYGYKGRVAVIPNGVGRTVECSAEEVEVFRVRHGVQAGSRVLLFLSRIARKKNLPLLLRTFAKNVKAWREWTLVIAGTDERGHIEEVRGLIRELGIAASVRLVGPVYGREKARAFAAASAFVLPSYSEGLPIAVLEAMEYGKPVLITDGWTLPAKTNERFGWRVSVDERAFGDALMRAMSASESELAEMGRAGRRLVRENFSWDLVARQARELYASLVNGKKQ